MSFFERSARHSSDTTPAHDQSQLLSEQLFTQEVASRTALKGTSSHREESRTVKDILGDFSLSGTDDAGGCYRRIDADQIAATKIDENTRTSTPKIDSAEFAPVAKDLLKSIDKEGTGRVTKEQLAHAMEDQKYQGKQAQVLAALFSSFGKFSTLDRDDAGDLEPGITRKSIDKFEELRLQYPKNLKESQDLQHWADKNLAHFAKDKHSLTPTDIKDALSDSKLSPENRAVLEKIKEHYREIVGWKNPFGLGKEDFRQYVANQKDQSPNSSLVMQVDADCGRVAKEAQSAGRSNDLFATKNPLDSIKPDAIRQGNIGDCFFLAALAAVAKAQPQKIRDAIKDNHDGTYTVSFPGAKGEKITVPAPTQAELGLYNGGSKYGTWAAVMEEAFGKFIAKDKSRANPVPPQEGIGPGGGEAGPVIKLLTGSYANNIELDGKTKHQIAHILKAAFSTHPAKAVTTGIEVDVLAELGLIPERTEGNFLRGHEFTILGFTPGANGGTVLIRNPWGDKAGTTDGTIKVPLSTYIDNFGDLTVQE